MASPGASVNCPNDPHGLKRLRKSQAKTPEGMMRLAEKIIEGNLPQPATDRIERPKRPKYIDQRCVTIDPNAYRAPFNRVRSPREERKRRPEGWVACWVILPKVVADGLRTIAITFAQEQQHSDWPGERTKYPRTKNYHVTAALNAYFKRLGFEQFCVEDQKPAGHRVRRFVAPSA
jgi:hypothetical protein